MTLKTEQVLQNRYRILSLMGEGGMGAVYHAWDNRLDIPVALKEMVPQPGIDSRTLAQLYQQFQQEAQVLARLNHPHLVRVGDFFTEGSSAYLVMDFIEGEELANRIEQKGALPESQVLEWAHQLLDAMAYCHSQGIIHRDIKPQNVIIRPSGRVVLVDFGLVKLWDPQDPHTRTAMRGMGTPEYAPPEQYEVDAGHTDARSDIYGLGATLYHALTGQAPPTATLRMADPEQFMPLRNVRMKVGERTEAAVQKAMKLARSKRWQSAVEMAAALGFTDLSDVALPSSSVAPVSKPVRQRTQVMPGTISTTSSQRKRVPVWVWALGGLGLVGLVLAIAVVTGMIKGIGGMESSPTPIPTPIPSPTSRITLTPTPPLSPTHTPTLASTATKTPRPTSTTAQTLTPTSTATETPRPPTATMTPAPRVVQPILASPAGGGTYQGLITLEWSGSLGAGQTYQVTIYHPESNHPIQSGLLTSPSWVVDLPAEKHGEWRWRVSVVQNGEIAATSLEWMFWFQPGGGGGGGGNGEKPPVEPTRD